MFTMLLVATSTSICAQQDWADFRKYEASNAEYRAQPNDGQRIVFFGNSITENWGRMRPEFFSQNGYICRGISGQTSYQFLVRFREDVVSLRPKVVVINAGTNDIAENNHRYVEDRTLGNIISMCEIAKANKIKVILTTVTPCGRYSWKTDITNVPAKIESLNARIRDYADKHKIPFIDYYTPMVVKEGVKKGYMYEELTQDGCHPTEAGYTIMEPLAKAVVEKCAGRKSKNNSK